MLKSQFKKKSRRARGLNRAVVPVPARDEVQEWHAADKERAGAER